MIDTRVMNVVDQRVGTVIGWHVNGPNAMDTYDIEWEDNIISTWAQGLLVMLDDLDSESGLIVDYWKAQGKI